MILKIWIDRKVRNGWRLVEDVKSIDYQQAAYMYDEDGVLVATNEQNPSSSWMPGHITWMEDLGHGDVVDSFIYDMDECEIVILRKTAKDGHVCPVYVLNNEGKTVERF